MTQKDNLERNINKALKPFQHLNNRKSFFIVFTSIAGMLLSIAVGIILYNITWYYSILLWVPIFVFMCRSFVFIHDCGHNSLFTKPWQNDLAGSISGFFILVPFGLWQCLHNMHHGSVGNLNKREVNPELWTYTVKEYQNLSNIKKLAYRLYRSTLGLIIIAPILFMLLERIPYSFVNKKANVSVLAYNLIYAAVIYLLVTQNWLVPFFLIYFIPLFVFYVFALSIFYLQHHYEETYWEIEPKWNLFDASINGSSYIEFGPVMSWVTGNVGYHHIHHLFARIPFYNLKKASTAIKGYVDKKPISYWSLLDYMNLKLWDSKSRKLVHFSAVSSNR